MLEPALWYRGVDSACDAASHIGVLISVPAARLLIQLPANAPQKAMEDGPNTGSIHHRTTKDCNSTPLYKVILCTYLHGSLGSNTKKSRHIYTRTLSVQRGKLIFMNEVVGLPAGEWWALGGQGTCREDSSLHLLHLSNPVKVLSSQQRRNLRYEAHTSFPGQIFPKTHNL